ncbi:ribonuclease H-like domain-containing protein [Tanacetum coccineum]
MVDWKTHSEDNDNLAFMANNSTRIRHSEVQPKGLVDAPIIEELNQIVIDDDVNENPHRTLKNKGIIDSGCSRHMTGNKAYLADYQDINGGPVAFGGSRGYITGKGKIQTDFKLPDENQILLKVPRQNNMYSFNLENIVPLGGLACLIAKATTDESNLWHRRLGHVNFKNLNRLVKGNLVRGLPTKLFQNGPHLCCLSRKESNQSFLVRQVSSSISTPYKLLPYGLVLELHLEREKSREEEQSFWNDLQDFKGKRRVMGSMKLLIRNHEQDTRTSSYIRQKPEAEKTSSTNVISTVSTTAKASGTNFVNTVSIPVGTASANKGLSLSNTTNSQEDEASGWDFYKLGTIVNVSPIPIKSSSLSSFNTYSRRSNISSTNKKQISEALEDESWVDAMQEGTTMHWFKGGIMTESSVDDRGNEGCIMTLKMSMIFVFFGVNRYQQEISKEQRNQRKPSLKEEEVQIESVLNQGGRNAKGDGTEIKEVSKAFSKKKEEGVELKAVDLANDEELARKVQEEWEVKRRNAKPTLLEDEAANAALIKNFDDTPKKQSRMRINKKDEESTKRKLGTRKKMKSRKRRYIQHTSEDDSDKENDDLRLYLTIAQDEDKEVDYEILDRKYPIIDWKTEDLNAVYQLVMNKYQDEMPEGFERVLWGDLMVLFNPDEQDEFWSSQHEWKIISWKLHNSSGNLKNKTDGSEKGLSVMDNTHNKMVINHHADMQKEMASPQAKGLGFKDFSNPLIGLPFTKNCNGNQLTLFLVKSWLVLRSKVLGIRTTQKSVDS